MSFIEFMSFICATFFIGIGLIVVGAFIENERPFSSVVGALVFAFGGMLIFYGADYTISFMKKIPSNWHIISLYLGIGIIWALVKWSFYVKALAQDFSKYLKKFLSSYKPNLNVDEERQIFEFRHGVASVINANLNPILKSSVSSLDKSLEPFTGKEDIKVGELVKTLQFSPNNKKSTISLWVIFWPISFISTMFKELIINLVGNIIDGLRGVFSRIASYAVNSAVKNIE